MSDKATGTYEIMPDTLYLPDLPPRIARMIEELIKHQGLITSYDRMCITFNCVGIKPDLIIEKLRPNS